MTFEEHKQLLITQIEDHLARNYDQLLNSILKIIRNISDSKQLKENVGYIVRICTDSMEDPEICNKILYFTHYHGELHNS